jgi:hypothetical protein
MPLLQPLEPFRQRSKQFSFVELTYWLDNLRDHYLSTGAIIKIDAE